MRRALLVEDSEHMAVLFGSVLELAFPGIEIQVAPNLAEAHGMLSNTVNIAVVDVNLPDGSGLTFIEAIRRQYPHVYIVVATMFDDDEHVFSALARGANGYVLKEEPIERLQTLFKGIPSGTPPVSPSVLRRIIRRFQQPDLSAGATKGALTGLSNREKEVHACLIKGYSSKETAKVLGISSHTVNDHVKNIYRKLAVTTRAELIALSA